MFSLFAATKYRVDVKLYVHGKCRVNEWEGHWKAENKKRRAQKSIDCIYNELTCKKIANNKGCFEYV